MTLLNFRICLEGFYRLVSFLLWWVDLRCLLSFKVLFWGFIVFEQFNKILTFHHILLPSHSINKYHLINSDSIMSLDKQTVNLITTYHRLTQRSFTPNVCVSEYLPLLAHWYTWLRVTYSWLFQRTEFLSIYRGLRQRWFHRRSSD